MTIDEDTLCHCGTMPEAVEAAKKLFIQLTASDCPIWALGVATALRTIAVEAQLAKTSEPALTKNQLSKACNHFSDRTRELIDIVEILEEAKAKRRSLHN